jgi:hypothetical protein
VPVIILPCWCKKLFLTMTACLLHSFDRKTRQCTWPSDRRQESMTGVLHHGRAPAFPSFISSSSGQQTADVVLDPVYAKRNGCSSEASDGLLSVTYAFRNTSTADGGLHGIVAFLARVRRTDRPLFPAATRASADPASSMQKQQSIWMGWV